MKKVFFIALLAVFSFSAYAQDYQKAVGLRLGYPLGLTYKQFTSATNGFEVIADLDIFSNGVTKIFGSGYYLWQKPISQVQGLSWFAGPGVSAGMFLWKGGDAWFNAAIAGLGGVEYKFADLPLAISADFNPRFYFMHSSGFYAGGAVSVRYTF